MTPWQVELLEECRAGRLGTIAADGRPRLVPVCYALLGGEVVIAIDEKPKRGTDLARLRDIGRDPRATLLVDRYDDDWSRLAWVRLDCGARVLATGAEMPSALAALCSRYSQYAAMALETRPLIVLTPERVAAWRARSEE